MVLIFGSVSGVRPTMIVDAVGMRQSLVTSRRVRQLVIEANRRVIANQTGETETVSGILLPTRLRRLS